MTEFPHLFVSGMPACGKSTFGRWLEENHGYKHYDFEKEMDSISLKFQTQLGEFTRHKRPNSLIDSMIQEGAPIVFNWGFPVSCIDIATSLSDLLTPVWFHADPAIAEEKFKERGDVSMEAFQKQMSDLSKYGSILDSIFGGHTIQTIDSSGDFMSNEEIFEKIREFEPGGPYNSGQALRA